MGVDENENVSRSTWGARGIATYIVDHDRDTGIELFYFVIPLLSPVQLVQDSTLPSHAPVSYRRNWSLSAVIISLITVAMDLSPIQLVP